MESFGAPVEWRPAVVLGLFFLWLALSRVIGDLAAVVIVIILGVVILLRDRLRDWFRNRAHGVR